MSVTVEAGEDLGLHVWDEEVIKETRGEFLFTLVSFDYFHLM